jgi:hypothetical protein
MVSMGGCKAGGTMALHPVGSVHDVALTFARADIR